ncbi:MAG: hypothetical protein GEU79_01235 [Acidimicrobiia bacterium]|nr:hypothetical protein [Acidimicrobiia bacterium]
MTHHEELGIIMGIIQSEQLEHGDPDTIFERVMVEGPTTVRPSEETKALTERMRSADVAAILVSSSDGKLLGLYQAAAY